MNSFWLKIAVLGMVCVGLVMVVKYVKTPKLEMETKSFYEATEKRDKELRAEPQPIEPVKEQQLPTAKEQTPPVEQIAPEAPAQQAAPAFKQLSEEEAIEAEKLFNEAVPFSHIGHLPVTGYKTMVDLCRQIIEKFPGSEYAWKAKRMLKEMPERFRERYKITEEEIDLGNYK